MECTGGRLVNSNSSNLQNSIQPSNANALSPGKPPAHPRPSSFSPISSLQHQNRARRQHVGSQQYEPQQLTIVADRPSLQQARFNGVMVRGSIGATAPNGLTSSSMVVHESDSIRHNHSNVSHRQQTVPVANSVATRLHPSTRRNLDAVWPNSNQQVCSAAPPHGHLVNRVPHPNHDNLLPAATGDSDCSLTPVNQQTATFASQGQHIPRAVGDIQQQSAQHIPSSAASMKGSDHLIPTRVSTRSNPQPVSLTRRPLLAPRNNAAQDRVNETVQRPPRTPTYYAVAEETVHISSQVETPCAVTRDSPAAGLGGQPAGRQVPQPSSNDHVTQGTDVYENTAILTESVITQNCQQLNGHGNESDSETVIYDAVSRDGGSALNDWQQDGLGLGFDMGSENMHELMSLRPTTADIISLAQERQHQPQHQVQPTASQGRAYQQYPHSSAMLYSFGHNTLQPLRLPPWLSEHHEDTIVSTEEIQTQECDNDIEHNHRSQQDALHGRLPTHFQRTANYFQQHNPNLYTGTTEALGLNHGRQQQQWQQDVQIRQHFARDNIDYGDTDMCDDNSGPDEDQADTMNVGVFQAENSRESPVYPGAQLVPGRPQQLTRPLVVRVRRRTQDDYQSCSEEDVEDSTVDDNNSHNCSDDDDEDQQVDPDIVSSDMCRYSFDAAQQTMTVAEELTQSHPADGGNDHVARNASLRPLLERLGLNFGTHTAQDAPADPYHTQQAGLQEEPEESSSPTLGRFTRVLPPLATHSPVRPYGLQRHSLGESPRTPRSVQQPDGDTSPIHHWMSDHAARLLLPHNMRGMADLFTSDMLWSTRRSAAVLDEIRTMHGDTGSVYGRDLAASCPMPLSQQAKVFGSPIRPLAGYHGAKDVFALDVLSGHLPKPGVTELLSNKHFMTQLLSSLPGVNPEHPSIKGILMILSGELPGQLTSLDLLPGQVSD